MPRRLAKEQLYEDSRHQAAEGRKQQDPPVEHQHAASASVDPRPDEAMQNQLATCVKAPFQSYSR